MSAPPDSPAEGARYIVSASPTGAWSGHSDDIAAYQDGAWAFYEPVEGLAVMESQHLLFNTSQALRKQCVDGITVNKAVLEHYMNTTVGIVTALNPVLGYEKATELANEAYKTNKGVLEIIRERKLLTEAQIAEILNPAKLTNLDKNAYARKKKNWTSITSK